MVPGAPTRALHEFTRPDEADLDPGGPRHGRREEVQVHTYHPGLVDTGESETSGPDARTADLELASIANCGSNCCVA